MPFASIRYWLRASHRHPWRVGLTAFVATATFATLSPAWNPRANSQDVRQARSNAGEGQTHSGISLSDRSNTQRTHSPIPANSRIAIDQDSRTSDGVLSSSSQGWITFEKCPVFAIDEVALPAQDSGMIVEMNVQLNQAVNAGDVLGKLDYHIAELERSVAALQVQVASSEALDGSEARLAEFIVEETKIQMDNYEEMLANRTASTGDFRQRQLAYEQAKVRLVQAKASVKQRELKAKLAQASLTLHQQKLDRLNFVSPIQGVIKRIDHKKGEWVAAGEAILKIVRLDELFVDCLVDLDRFDPPALLEQRVKVTLQRQGTPDILLVGKVQSFDPEVSAYGKIRLHVVVQNQRKGEHWLLLPGMNVTMQMPVRP